MNKFKISFFLPSLRGGGAEKVFVTLANEFAKRNFKVDLVLAQKEGPYLKEVSEKVRMVNLKAKRVLYSLLPLIKYLKKEKPDVLISTLDHANIIAILAKLISRVQTKIIVRVANTLSLSLKGTKFHKRWLRLYGVKIFYPFADKIIAVSKGVADDLVKRSKIPRKKIKVIYNPTDFEKIQEKMKENTGHPWLDRKECPVILGIGKFHQQKNFPLLLKSFALLRKKRKIKLIILGEGKERKDLENLIRKLNLQEDVDLPGFKENPYSFLAKADVYVLSSLWEGFPNTLLEALACGTPVVSTNCLSGPAEILENGKYGKLIPINNERALAKAIEETLESPLNSKILEEKAKDFGLKKIAKEYLKLFKN
ncbi:glycosyltransferase [bacterium]|nr:glycosyltransferase [bacterium]